MRANISISQQPMAFLHRLGVSSGSCGGGSVPRRNAIVLASAQVEVDELLALGLKLGEGIRLLRGCGQSGPSCTGRRSQSSGRGLLGPMLACVFYIVNVRNEAIARLSA